MTPFAPRSPRRQKRQEESFFSWRFWRLGALGAILFATSAKAESTTQPSTQTAPQTFVSKDIPVQFDYPGGWVPEKTQTSVLDVCPPPNSVKGSASLSLDVPKLPWHIPGMITAGMVEDGYVKDLRKNQIHDAKVEESTGVKICGCSGRRVKCCGREDGKAITDVAVILVHKDRVYIFSCDGDPDGYTTARAALDEAVTSLQWK